MVYVTMNLITKVQNTVVDVDGRQMRNKNGRHIWGTQFDEHEEDAPIGEWYREGQIK